MSNPTNGVFDKRWPCLTCDQPIRVNPHAGLGEPRYLHEIPNGHLALRGPDSRVEGSPS